MYNKYFGTTVLSRIINLFLIPVVSVSYATFFITKANKTSVDYIILVPVVLVAFLLIANQKFLDKKYQSLLLYFSNKDLTYAYIKITLEYLDSKGKMVALKREDFVSNVSIKNKKLAPFPLEVSGSFVKSETSAVNGSFTFPSKKKVLFHTNLENRLNNGVSFYSTIMKNSFLNDTEEMIFFVKNFCKLYKLEIKIPRNRKLTDAKLLRRERSLNQSINSTSNQIINQTSNNWEEVTEGRILKSYSLEKVSIISYVENLHPEEEYKLIWTLN